MKKNLLKIAFVAVFGIAVSYNVYSSKFRSELSDLMLDNVEALAYIEGWIGKPVYRIEFHQMWHWTCYTGGYLQCPI